MFCTTGLPRWAPFGNQNTSGAYFAPDADEKELLKRQAKFLENQLNNSKRP